jgi:hypothetical protein
MTSKGCLSSGLKATTLQGIMRLPFSCLQVAAKGTLGTGIPSLLSERVHWGGTTGQIAGQVQYLVQSGDQRSYWSCKVTRYALVVLKLVFLANTKRQICAVSFEFCTATQMLFVVTSTLAVHCTAHESSKA